MKAFRSISFDVMGLLSYPAANFLAILAIGHTLTTSAFARYSLVVGAAAMLAIIPGYGIGHLLINPSASSPGLRINLIVAYFLIAALGCTLLSIATPIPIVLLWAGYLLAICETLYLLGEAATKGLRNRKRLVAMRLGSALGLVCSGGAVLIADNLYYAWLIAVIVRAVTLGAGGIWTIVLSDLIERGAQNWGVVRSELTNSLKFSLGIIGSAAFLFADKMVFGYVWNLDLLGRYAFLAMITLTIGNRLADIALSLYFTGEDKSTSGSRFKVDQLLTKILLATLMFIFLIAVTRISVFFLGKNVSMTEIALMSLAGAILFLGNVQWWLNAINNGQRGAHAAASSIAFATFAIFTIVFAPPSIAEGLIILNLALFGWLIAGLVLDKMYRSSHV